MSEWRLRRHPHWAPCPGPVVAVVMDGVGIGRRDQGDAVWLARTPTLDRLETGAWLPLIAHGTAMGLPSDNDMGNSEVGHNVLGAGRTFEQGALLVQSAIASRALFAGEAWTWVAGPSAADAGALHFIGLLSDGNVHSHQDHLHAMLREARAMGCQRVYCHVLLDGRDVHPTSAHTYIESLEAELSRLRAEGFDYRIASGGGRMVTTMDRYEADWSIVERGWKAHVLGHGRGFPSAAAAVESYRAERPGLGDQNLPEFVVVDQASSSPVGPIRDGDGVVFFNFRGDRALEMTRAFVDDQFASFDRVRRPAVRFVGMMQYDGDLRLPPRYLVTPPAIDGTMGQLLAESGLHQVACAETQKYGHVTYFWNGNRSGRFDPSLEEYIEVASDRLPFDERPEMKAAEVTDAVIGSLRGPTPPAFVRLNYANGDMVGHTGDLAATIAAIEAVDTGLGRLLAEVEKLGGAAIVTADHGNADQMFRLDSKTDTYSETPLTSHSLNAVPLFLFEPQGARRLSPLPGASLGNVASTALELLGFEAPAGYLPSLLERP